MSKCFDWSSQANEDQPLLPIAPIPAHALRSDLNSFPACIPIGLFVAPMKQARRDFLVSSSAALSLAGLPQTIASEAPLPKIKYIDIHTHLGAFYHGRELTAELLVKFMDEHDVER